MGQSRGSDFVKFIRVCLFAGLFLFTGLGVIKAIWISFDIDEAYAIAQSYRLAVGDIMFKEMWESHQMSAFLGAMFIKPFLWISGGTTGIALYLRIVATLIHLSLGVWLYVCGTKKCNRNVSLLIVLLHINFLPKWVMSLEFEVMQYWAVLIVLLCALSLQEDKKSKYKNILLYIIAGFAMFMAMMTYPTMILLYPVYAIGFYMMIPGEKKDKWIGVGIFTGTCFIVGCVFLIYIFSAMNLSEFIHYVKYIFMDESHTENSLGTRLLMYGDEWKTFWEFIRVKLFILVVAVFSISVWAVKRNPDNKKNIIVEGILLVVLGTLICTLYEHTRGTLLDDKNQFYMYFRYLIASLAGVVLLFGRKKSGNYLWFGILPGVVGVIASILITNMTMEIAFARIYIAVIATSLLLGEKLWEEKCSFKITKMVVLFAVLWFLISLFIPKLVQIRVTGCLPVTIKADLAKVEEGPAKGIYALDEIAYRFNVNTKILEEYVQEDDKLLYFGSENLYYLTGGATLATPSTQGTVVYNEMFTSYYEEHPDRIPNLIVIDKTYETEPVYRYQKQNQIILDWIEENYQDAEVLEKDFLTIIRKK